MPSRVRRVGVVDRADDQGVDRAGGRRRTRPTRPSRCAIEHALADAAAEDVERDEPAAARRPRPRGTRRSGSARRVASPRRSRSRGLSASLLLLDRRRRASVPRRAPSASARPSGRARGGARRRPPRARRRSVTAPLSMRFTAARCRACRARAAAGRNGADPSGSLRDRAGSRRQRARGVRTNACEVDSSLAIETGAPSRRRRAIGRPRRRSMHRRDGGGGGDVGGEPVRRPRARVARRSSGSSSRSDVAQHLA